MTSSATKRLYRKLAIEHLENCGIDPAIRPLVRPVKDKDAYNEIASAISRMRTEFEPIKKQEWAAKGKFDETEVLLISDTHFGKKVVIDGQVMFDKDIAAERFKSIVASMRHLNSSYILPNHQISELVIVMLGDIIDGEAIYRGQEYNSDLPLIDQLMFAAALIKKELLDQVSQMFGSVRVIVNSGNHGEIRNDRGEHSMHPKTNMDSMLGLILQFGSQDLKNVTFEIASTTMHTTMIRGWKFLMAHRLPSPQSGSPGRAKYGGWFERFRYDAVLRAHFHVPDLGFYNLRPVIMNGSLVGVDDYSLDLSYNTIPAQVLFTVSEKRPVALFWIVDTGHRVKEAEVRAALE